MKNMSRDEQLSRLRSLLQEKRWAALATWGRDDQPEGSMVAYALNEQMTEVYLHLSELAAHTRNLQKRPDATLVISECDDGRGDPQQLARASVTGTVIRMKPEDSGYEEACRRYLSRLPDAEPLFSFGDFHLFRFVPGIIRFVGGFGQAISLRATELSGAE